SVAGWVESFPATEHCAIRGQDVASRECARRTLPRRRRSDHGVRLVAAFERVRDKAARLHLLDESVQIARYRFAALIALLRGTHRLTDFHEPAVHDAYTGIGFGELDERLFHPRRGFELVLEEGLNSVFAPDQLGVLERAGAKE